MLRSITLTSAITRSTTRPTTGFGESAAYSPVDEFSGGANGWLFDGSAGGSVYLQSTGGAAAGNGDPLGSVSDLSGNDNNVVQTTGGAKPVCNVSGGVRAITLADGKYINATLNDSIGPARTQVVVYKGGTLSTTDAAYIMQEISTGLWDFLLPTPGGFAYIYDNNTTGTNLVNTPAWGDIVILVMKKWLDDATWKWTATAYDADGAVVQSVTYNAFGSSSVTTIEIGYPGGTPQHTTYFPFVFGIEGTIDDTEIIAYCVSKFGTWSPA